MRKPIIIFNGHQKYLLILNQSKTTSTPPSLNSSFNLLIIGCVYSTWRNTIDTTFMSKLSILVRQERARRAECHLSREYVGLVFRSVHSLVCD
jgi:hypothetical protein